jgi:hypothetical protein
MSKKIKVKESEFLSWYFSDLDDILTFGRNMITELQSQGFVKESVQSLLDRCGYIPGHISENPNDDNEYDPEDVELISERVPAICQKCGVEDDGSMDNFCPNCLTLK